MNTNKTFTNTMPWTNTQVRNNPFPLEVYSIFDSLAAAETYALSNVVSYEGQIVAVTDEGKQKVYVLDSTMPNGLRQLAAGDDASQLTDQFNQEISARISADLVLSGAISSEVSERESAYLALSGAISSEVSAREAAETRLTQNLSVTIEDGGTPELSSVLKTYVVKQGGEEVGRIDIPKDFLVKTATIGTVTETDIPYAGAKVGDKYIDLEINTKSDDDTLDKHLYLPIKDMVDAYSGGMTNTVAVTVGDDNVIQASVREGSIGTAHLSAEAVTEAKIAGGAVTTAKIADKNVTNGKIADGAVGAAQLSAEAVTTAKIADSAVTTAKILDDSVTTAKILDGNVTTVKIADKNVTTAKIDDSAVGTAQLSAEAVTTAKIADSAVTTVKIADGNITEGKLADNAVTNAKLADSAVGTAELSAQAVTTAKLADSAVTNGKIADSAVGSSKIENGAVGTDKIADNAVMTAKIGAESVTDAKLAAGAVTTGKIADGNVTSEKLAVGAVTAGKIAAGSITKNELSSDVIDYIDNSTSGAFDDAKDYTDKQIDVISADWSGAASKTVTAVQQRDGKVSLSAVDIAVQASQVTDLDTVLDGYVPAENASSSASPSDKLQTASEVSSIAQAYIETLDYDETVAAGKTISKIVQMDGKISVDTADIQITKLQVTGLEGDFTTVNSKISDLSGDVKMLSDDKLDKSELSTFNNVTGLSAATPDNPVVTKSQISAIAGAMHFKGVVTKQDGESDIEACQRKDPNPVAGDIVMIQDSTLEYIYDGTSWMQLGDETQYVKQTAYTQKMAQLDQTDLALSTSVDNKIFADGVKVESLSVLHVSQDEYHQKVVSGTVLSNEIYMVSSDTFNMYDERIVNLAEPELSSDAATKAYVDSKATSTAKDISEISSDVNWLKSNALSGVTLNGTAFTVENNVVSMQINCIDGGSASM